MVLDQFLSLLYGLRSAFADRSVRGLLAFTLSLISGGSLFYWLVEGWSLLDATYFSVITIATVGYGDLAPKTAAGKIFTMIYVLCGIGLFLATAAAVGRHVVRRASEEDKEL
jgi:voltage-gated potassium channel